MNANEAKEAIEAGNETKEEIAEYVDLHAEHVGKELKAFCEEGVLERERNGYAYHYSVPETPRPAQTAAPDADADGEAYPVNRDYDWQAEFGITEEDVAEYIPTNGEWEEFSAEVAYRGKTGGAAKCLLGGPTGSGKTTFAENVAVENDALLVTIQVRYSMDEADLLGSPNLDDGNTTWQDGPLTKALLATLDPAEAREKYGVEGWDGDVVLLIDEANRAPARTKSTLFSALDHRAEVTLNGRGGEVIKGDPENLIVVATINEGVEYQTEQMDFAEQRRYGNRWNIDYLGVNSPAKEAQLVADRTEAPVALAEEMVQAANDVRDRAKDSTDREVNVGVPTAALLSWAEAAGAYAEAELNNPVMRGAKRAIITKFYEGSAADEVSSIISSRLDGAPFNAEALARWAGEGENTYSCHDCAFEAPEADLPEDARDWMECPECDGSLTIH